MVHTFNLSAEAEASQVCEFEDSQRYTVILYLKQIIKNLECRMEPKGKTEEMSSFKLIQQVNVLATKLMDNLSSIHITHMVV